MVIRVHFEIICSEDNVDHRRAPNTILAVSVIIDIFMDSMLFIVHLAVTDSGNP
jgi:hypothetical protein